MLICAIRKIRQQGLGGSYRAETTLTLRRSLPQRAGGLDQPGVLLGWVGAGEGVAEFRLMTIDFPLLVGRGHATRRPDCLPEKTCLSRPIITGGKRGGGAVETLLLFFF